MFTKIIKIRIPLLFIIYLQKIINLPEHMV